MSNKWIVALDQGTSSCRAFAIDSMGKVRAQKNKIFLPQRPQKGFSSYDASKLLAVQMEVLNALLDEIGPSNAAALAVCSQRSTVVLWDKRTGAPVAPVLTWEDGRALAESNNAALSQQEVHTQTGLFKTPYFSAPKIAWCLKNCPAAHAAAEADTLCVAPVASYLIWHLTEGRVFATDPTLAQRTLLWDIQTGSWSEKLCKAFAVSITSLPCLKSTISDYGSYIYKGVAIPICVCVADQQAAAVYERLSVGQTMVNYGTGAFVLYHTGNKLSILPGLLTSVAASKNSDDKQFLLEGPIFAAGSVLEWLKTKGIDVQYGQLNELAQTATSPVLLLPALGGLGAPFWDYRVQVATENVTSRTQSADWIAGVFHAIAARVADIIYYLKENKFAIDSIRVSGGLSTINYLLQTQANIIGMPVYKFPETESTVLGAACLAAEWLKWEVFNQPLLPTQPFSPHVSIQTAQTNYHAWQQFVQRQRR